MIEIYLDKQDLNSLKKRGNLKIIRSDYTVLLKTK